MLQYLALHRVLGEAWRNNGCSATGRRACLGQHAGQCQHCLELRGIKTAFYRVGNVEPGVRLHAAFLGQAGDIEPPDRRGAQFPQHLLSRVVGSQRSASSCIRLRAASLTTRNMSSPDCWRGWTLRGAALRMGRPRRPISDGCTMAFLSGAGWTGGLRRRTMIRDQPYGLARRPDACRFLTAVSIDEKLSRDWATATA